jgi:hypothetical protein
MNHPKSAMNTPGSQEIEAARRRTRARLNVWPADLAGDLDPWELSATFDWAVRVVDRADIPHITRWISCGINPGVISPFAALLVGLGADGRLYVTDEYRYNPRAARGMKTDVEHVAALQEWMASISPLAESAGDAAGVTPERIVVDPASPEFRWHLRRAGITTVGGDRLLFDGLRLITQLLAGGLLLIARNCGGLIDELSSGLRNDEIHRRTHSLRALHYAVFSTRAWWASDVCGPASSSTEWMA